MAVEVTTTVTRTAVMTTTVAVDEATDAVVTEALCGIDEVVVAEMIHQ